VDNNGYFVAVSGQRLIYGIVDNLENHVMKPGSITGIAYVHSRALAHCLKALEDLDAVGIIFVAGPLFFFTH
jgi:hypothetical protein